MDIAAISGHRPEKITNPERTWGMLMQAYSDLGTEHVIQGMAAGVDLWSAKLANAMGIPFTCARPWAGHTPRVADKMMYERALSNAAKIVNVDLRMDYPGPWVYQKRNEWMVDNADYVIAVWDGSKGGTFNCVKYAIEQEKSVYRLNPETFEVGWF